MCKEREPVSKVEVESKDFEEQKKKRKAEGWEYEPSCGSWGAGPSAAGAPDPPCIYVGNWVRKKDKR